MAVTNRYKDKHWRLCKVSTADGADPVITVRRASIKGMRFILGETADGKRVPVQVGKLDLFQQRGILARTADDVKVLVRVDVGVPYYWITYDNSGKMLAITKERYPLYDIGAYNPDADMFCDNQANIYSVLIGISSIGVYKHNMLGELLWYYSDSRDTNAYSGCVDDEYNVYIPVEKQVAKIDSDGNRLWYSSLPEDDVLGDINRISIDSANNRVFIETSWWDDARSSSEAGVLLMSAVTGSEIWRTTVMNPRTVNTDGQGGYYVGFNDSVNWHVRKLDSSGNPVWTYDGGSSNEIIHYIELDEQKNVYCVVYDEVSDTSKIVKLNSSGSFQWAVSFFTGEAWTKSSIAVDPTGRIFAGEHELDRDGNVLYTHDNRGEFVAVRPGRVGSFPTDWGL